MYICTFYRIIQKFACLVIEELLHNAVQSFTPTHIYMHIFVLNNPSLGLYSDLFIKLTYSFLNTISEFRLVEIESSLEIQYKYVNEAIITGLIQC